MSAFDRREAWARLAALIADGLPDPESIDFNVPSGNRIVGLNFDTVEDLHTWAKALDCELHKPVQHPGSDKIQHHANGHRSWHGLSVSLWAYTPAAVTPDIARAGEEVAGADGAASATTPLTESSPAGPAVALTTPEGDGGDCRLQDRPGPTIVLVESPVPGHPPARAELCDDTGTGTTVKVIYCDSRTGARVARRRILGPAPAESEG